MIEHKIVTGTPDDVCHLCNQCYKGTCVAFQVPHSDIEREAREHGNYGMECDDMRIKELRWRRFGLLYRTPAEKFNRPYEPRFGGR